MKSYKSQASFTFGFRHRLPSGSLSPVSAIECRILLTIAPPAAVAEEGAGWASFSDRERLPVPLHGSQATLTVTDPEYRLNCAITLAFSGERPGTTKTLAHVLLPLETRNVAIYLTDCTRDTDALGNKTILTATLTVTHDEATQTVIAKRI